MGRRMSAASRTRTVTVQIEELHASRFRAFSNDLPGFSWTFDDTLENTSALAYVLANYCPLASGGGDKISWTGSGSRVDMAVASLNGHRIVAIEHFEIVSAEQPAAELASSARRLAARLRASTTSLALTMFGRRA